MKNLKSLEEFDNESNKLSSAELLNVSGGRKNSWTEVTGVNGGDRQPMSQNFFRYGEDWVATGPPYASGPAYKYP